jgi:1,4-alpha-glucan branching enzyme
VEKTDPFAVHDEIPPKTASVVWDLEHEWEDGDWMASRRERNRLSDPISVYEVHLGSWVRVPEDGYRSLSYREIAPRLAEYAKDLGFTHVELMPVMEHPFFGSWGYQVTGYFAPSSRYGTPEDFAFLVDTLHRAGIGVILDWVPSHFPKDQHGLAWFDGTHLFEHEDPRRGIQPDWDSLIFNYGRHEVRSFLLSVAMHWLGRFHADGLRTDAVASMLYLDYSRKDGEWIPNPQGGRENLEAIDFLRRLNTDVYRAHPDVQTIAEESTAWAGVSKPVETGGLGFGMKWDMGWMHDTLKYMAHDPVHRRFHHDELTFRAIYAFTENFMLPLSHDEVVHGKRSLLGKMPGDDWQKFANLRLLYAYQWSQPGKKLLFMGGEFAQWSEWKHDGSLEWHLLEFDRHRGVSDLVRDLNRVYREEPALHEMDCDPAGFEWVVGDDRDNSVLAYLRKGGPDARPILVVVNFTPVVREGYRVGVPAAGRYEEILNSDAERYGGSGVGNPEPIEAEPVPSHGRDRSIVLTIPPLAAVFLTAPAAADRRPVADSR